MSAQVLAKPIKEKTGFSLDWPMRFVRAGEKGKRIIDAMPYTPYDSNQLGVHRIRVELDGANPTKTATCATRYSATVKFLSDKLNAVLPMDRKSKGTEEQFFREIWALMHGTLGIRYGNNKSGFLWESVKTGKWDCDNSSILVSDVARKVGVKTTMVGVNSMSHVVVGSDNFVYEPTTGFVFPIKVLDYRDPSSKRFSDEATEICAITHNQRGIAFHIKKQYTQALAEFIQAESLSPNTALFQNNVGIGHGNLRQNETAFHKFDRAIQLDPKNHLSFESRGNLYMMYAHYGEAALEFTKAIENYPSTPKLYIRRLEANILSGKIKDAITDVCLLPTKIKTPRDALEVVSFVFSIAKFYARRLVNSISPYR